MHFWNACISSHTKSWVQEFFRVDGYRNFPRARGARHRSLHYIRGGWVQGFSLSQRGWVYVFLISGGLGIGVCLKPGRLGISSQPKDI